MNEQRDARVVDEIESLFGRGVRGHDDYWVGMKRSGGQVGVIHQRDVGK